MTPGNMRTLCALLVLFLPGCVTGIPDADSSIPAARVEPCEVWVTVEPEHHRTCMSRARWERDYRPLLIP